MITLPSKAARSETKIFPETSVCYSYADREKIADTIVQLEKCRVEVAEQDWLIRERLTTFGNANEPSFWQDPSFVVGGMLVSFSMGAILTYLVVRDRG
jgi:hypothetical protein